MTNLIQQPTMVFAAGNKHKEIAEYVGRLNSATEALSIAHMKSTAGWIEPGTDCRVRRIYCSAAGHPSCGNSRGNYRRKGRSGNPGSPG